MYPAHFIQYLLLFHINRDYFECHEVMEEYWKQEGKGNSLWKGLILIAVLFYHYRRNNFNGAKKLISKAIMNIRTCKDEVDRHGIDSERLLNILNETEAAILRKKPYQPIAFPIVDNKLINTCSNTNDQFLKYWSQPMENSDTFIIHKHLFRYEQIERR
ncbi:DUF309 domain-containing protein [Fervidibacillus halotolerans]|uniref:DUF309 domain-containing protein n=1 Tax=Fervidibacillus halotolerans TaxID=2980027 RepID=A0A9E8M3N2_9BACI|nr:DUF309 domain-containing protein [Fervidibacillus halotolerans]WAA13809.1 DUF309 domain-containing protein [Fervidibacillus halotolerans]